MAYGFWRRWGLSRVVAPADGPAVMVGCCFGQGLMRPDWKEQLQQRGIEVCTDVLREQALAVFRAYGQRTDTTVCNNSRRRLAARG